MIKNKIHCQTKSLSINRKEIVEIFDGEELSKAIDLKENKRYIQEMGFIISENGYIKESDLIEFNKLIRDNDIKHLFIFPCFENNSIFKVSKNYNGEEVIVVIKFAYI